MIGYFLSKNITNVVAFLIPAYLTYKSIKYKSGQDRMLRYWTVMGFFSFIEFYADIFVSWLPFYYEVKMLFLLWLVMPNSRGTPIIWSQYLKPFLNAREAAIDVAFNESKNRFYSQIDNFKSQAVNMVASRALSYVEASKNPLLISIATPILAAAVQPVPMIEDAKEQTSEGVIRSSKIEELPEEPASAPVTPCKMVSSPISSPASPKVTRQAAASSSPNSSPLRDVTNAKKISPSSSPTGKVSLVKPRKAVQQQQAQISTRLVKKGKATQDIENLQSQPLTRKTKATATTVNRQRNAAALAANHDL
eukprot:TRINITY_DN11635_c0_g1_i1.p1 TRINITY_DN11635_c0_g1~~TRINITY_DN11635_c0_g1_i1.p1  ORF type:complete len:307 (+),score=66.53 TRINITY_DN11635_c0_g1_i1:11-931(+)